ncbi:MAG: hypothetical protein GXP14_08560 [Gammaproteobacteria bacterium]|nr:hypothetical protein [Gammaproteobacteria bacterium]
MDSIKTFEVQLLGWAKSTSKKGPKVTFLLQDDDDIEFFEQFTLAKNKTAGQLFDIAVSLSSQDDQSKPEAKQKTRLSQDSAMLCKNENFQQWCYEKNCDNKLILNNEVMSKEYIYDKCGISSRSELDYNPEAVRRFKSMFREYGEWLMSRRKE